MKFYYTGAKTAGGEQTDPLASIGGYVSNTEVPEAQLGNIFGAPSRITDTDSRTIVITNEEAIPYTGITCTINNAIDNATEILVSASQLKMDINNMPYAPNPNITNIFQRETLVLPDMPAESSLVLFIKRNVKYPIPQTTADDLLAIEAGTLIPRTQDVITLTFTYNLTAPPPAE